MKTALVGIAAAPALALVVPSCVWASTVIYSSFGAGQTFLSTGYPVAGSDSGYPDESGVSWDAAFTASGNYSVSQIDLGSAGGA
ncbi:MAG: hypothetical protein ACLPTM_17180 [Steroidobacteraceae bacterium]